MLERFHNIITVWIAYLIALAIDIKIEELLDMVIILKEIFALLGFIVALGYTLYKFKKDWVGWNPKNRK